MDHICPPLKYLGKFKDENEPYKITPLPNAGDGATKTGGGRIKKKYTIKYRKKSKRKTLKL